MKLSPDKLLDEALEASEIAFWSYDLEDDESYFSDRYYKMLGYQPGDFPMDSAGWASILHPDEAPGIFEAFQKYLEDGQGRLQLEYRLKTATGGWRWVQSRAQVVERGKEGQTIRVSGTNIDITQRKLMERALVESEARWTSLVDEAPVGISLIDREGVVLFANRHQTGIEQVTPLGRNWKEFLAVELHPEIDRILDESFRLGKSTTFSTHRVLADGESIHFENHSSPVRENGQVTALLVLSIDVTAQHRAEHRRTKVSRRMEILLSMHNLPLPRHDSFGPILAAAVELTDSQSGFLSLYSSKEKAFVIQTSTPGAGALDELLPSMEDAGLRKQAVVVNEPPPGGGSFHRILLLPVIENETTVAVVGVLGKASSYGQDDVDEMRTLVDGFWQLRQRRDAEESLNRLYQAVEHSPVSLVITDPSGVIEYANPRYYTMTGFGQEEVAGSAFIQSADTVPTQTFLGLWADVLSGKEWQGELVDRKKDGQTYSEWVSISPVLDTVGAVSHLIVVMEDITDRKETQEILFRAQKMETVGQLAAGVAHDFNNLLTSMLAYNQMLLRKIEPGSALRKYPEGIEIAGRRAVDLVTGLLAVGRQQRMTKTSLDLGELLREQVPLLTSLVTQTIQFRTDLEAPPLMVEVDTSQISQVVVNLVSNARDALEGAGSISLSMGRFSDSTGVWAWFAVQDDGPGIPQALQEKIFDPFFTTKPIGQGTGLGLSVVQGIIQQHKGLIKLESSPENGTRFTVLLPTL